MTRRKKIPVPVETELPDRQYQPSRAELHDEMDMPRISLECARATFMRPFCFKKPPANCD